MRSLSATSRYRPEFSFLRRRASRLQEESSFAKAGRLVGLAIAKATGRREASTIAEKTGAKVGERLASDMERAIDWKRSGRPEKS